MFDSLPAAESIQSRITFLELSWKWAETTSLTHSRTEPDMISVFLHQGFLSKRLICESVLYVSFLGY